MENSLPTSSAEPKRPETPSMEFTPREHILYVDAYDSFSYNIVAMLEENLNVTVTVVTIDSEWPNGNMVEFLQHFEAVVLGPGPGNPATAKDAGIMKDLWTLKDAELIPVLGICLGFQSLCFHHGIAIERLPYPLHGQVRRITTVQSDIFEHLQDFEVTLYHSLYAKLGVTEKPTGKVHENGEHRGDIAKPSELTFLAWLFLDESESTTVQQIPMAARHKRKPFWGFQFHPESCKSDRNVCAELLRRWWKASLEFNERSGRLIRGGPPEVLMRPSPVTNSLPEITLDMLTCSVSTSETSAYRTFPLRNLTAERICEALNKPDSPTVLFQSNGRYSIISVPSPDSWRLEYYVPSKTMLLELVGDCNFLENRNSNGEQSGPKKRSAERILDVSQFWDSLRHFMDRKKVSSGCQVVPFWGGLLGYFSYEMGLASLERPKAAATDFWQQQSSSMRSSHGPDNLAIEDPPDVSLLWVERSIVIDNKTRQVYVQSTRGVDDIQGEWLDQMLLYLESLSRIDENEGQELSDSVFEGAMIELPNEDSYKRQIQACKAELNAGESYELCLTCETLIKLQSALDKESRDLRPWQLYKRLKRYNPAAFSAYARLGKVKVVSSSPECFLNWDRHSTLEMKPMKGTVKKSSDMTLEKAKEILSTTKEMAENLMIADLIRHDLYGICGTNRVHVEKLLEVEDHGRVYQMITHVKGQVDHRHLGFAVKDMPQLKTQNMSVHGITALQRCLPPGSMTGAPKERSCMHLSLIEGRKRGIYSGVMGYLDLGGGGSFSVLIRTAFSCARDDETVEIWRIGAGGAVTTLSTADGEWDEMQTKLRTVLNAFTPLDSKKGAK
ncbi:para aminobenzoic acid synthetase [Thermoascus aurantiacus ATCC 26904]